MSQPILLPKERSNKQYWGQLHGSALPLLLAEFCQQQSGVKLIIVPDTLSATQLQEELLFFIKNEPNTQDVLIFPDWETLPYDQFSPHQDIISARLHGLKHLQMASNGVVICAISTLMHRLCPPSFLNQHALLLKKDQNLSLGVFRKQLIDSGYRHVNKVLEHGEFAIRGALIDLFPMGSTYPYRIELFDEHIETLRRFDTESQRTIDKIPAITILPAHEFPLNEESISHFRRRFREQFSGNPGLCPLYEAVSDGQAPSGIGYYLPLFFSETATLFDYLPKNTHIVLTENASLQAESFWQEVHTRFSQRCYDVTRPVLSPEHGFISPTHLLTAINTYPQLRVQQQPSQKKGHVNFNCLPVPQLPVDRQSEQPLHRLKDYLEKINKRCLLVVESAGRREVLLDLLKQSGLKATLQSSWQGFLADVEPSLHIAIGPLSQGMMLQEAPFAIIVEAQLFGESSVPQRARVQKSVDPDLIIRDLAELRIGAPVVHLQFGVGRYQGLQVIKNNGMNNEFLVLAYAGSDKIYVPVTSLHLISRYTGADSDHAPLHRLGSDQWQKEKKKAAEKIHDVAVELLELYAKREAKPGIVYETDEQEYIRFASGFPFIETIDQQRAIAEIITDMKSPRPMDRLICGDVGFGKTEVAMRAAFIAVSNGKQVCVLAPTTLLAGQHFETFRDRFADFPFTIGLLSRFKSRKDTEHTLQWLKSGQVDIVIGTHKLLQTGVEFNALGLLIIDEEHRFGVKQKEQIKSLRTDVDILSMTATPIPRTLNMAMAGIRDISLIATPPAKRLAIKTFWQERHDSVIREAILREIFRGGQVFFLHNNVQTIDRLCQELQTLVPEARIKSAHGQMRERELERIMSDFYHHRFNVLVCTTIIETGIDIPTANTIIIDRADTFGLAQLHQLRGRVGRSHHQAYAYLLTPNKTLLTPDAVKRLEAIVSLEDLGAGFTLATHDLEIRGAGELLGDEQSGNMHAIGFHLFMEMLDKAVSSLKSGQVPSFSEETTSTGPEIDLNVSTIIPEDYISDIHTRLIFYKKIANCKHKEALQDIQIELIDRFGLIPASVRHLLAVTDLKNLAARLNIFRIHAYKQQAKIDFGEHPQIEAGQLIQLIQLQAKRYKMAGPTILTFTFEKEQTEERIAELYTLLTTLKKTT